MRTNGDWGPARPVRSTVAGWLLPSIRPYYAALGAFVEEHFMDVIAYLARRDISRFNPKALPPVTAARGEMHAATRSGAELALVEAAEELSVEMDGVFTKGDLKSVAMRMGHRGLSSLLESAPARIGKAMKDAGLESKRIKVGRKPTFIYWQRCTMDADAAEQVYRKRARTGPSFDG